MTTRGITDPNCQHLAGVVPSAAHVCASQAPPLQGQQPWRKALHNTCLSPWADPGGREQKLLLHHQLGQEAKTHVQRLGERERHGWQLGRCWGHKGRIIPRGTRLINGTFIRPPHPTQSTQTRGMGYLETQHAASRHPRPVPWGLCFDTEKAPSNAAPPRPPPPARHECLLC